MITRYLLAISAALVVIFVYGIFISSETNKWYRQEQVTAGEMIYRDYCMSCHGAAAVGGNDGNWRQRQEDGSFPPPPLNGTAHTWHHPLPQLIRTVQRGGVALGGKMPGFADKLNEEETRAVLAYTQSLWPDDIYTAWQKRAKP